MYKTSTINSYPRLRLISRLVVLLTTALLSLLVLVLLVLRVPAVQWWAAQQGATWLSEKTHNQFSVGSLRLGYGGSLQLGDLLWRTANGDTLLQLSQLNTRLYWWQLPKNIRLSHVELQGLQLKLQQSADSSWNYDALLAAFANEDTVAHVPTEAVAPAPQLELGPIQLTNIRLQYGSVPEGLDARLQLDSLALKTDTIDLNLGIYSLQSLFVSALQLNATQAARPPKAEAESPTEGPLPRLRVGKLELHHTQLAYSDENSAYELQLHQLMLQLPEADLARQRLQIDSLLLAGGRYHIRSGSSAPADTSAPSPAQPFAWPDWQLQLGSLQLLDQSISLQNDTSTRLFGWQRFDARLQYQAKQLAFGCELQDFNGNLGWEVARFSSRLELSDQQLQLHQLSLDHQRSRLTANGQVRYPDFNQLLQADERTQISLNLQLPSFYPADFAALHQLFLADSSLQKLPNERLALALAVNGSLQQLQIDTLQVNWGAGTQLAGRGQLFQPLQGAGMRVDFPKIAINSVQRDLQLLLPDTSVAWPAYLRAEGALGGHAKQLQTGWRLQMPEAEALLVAHYADSGQRRFGLDADVSGRGWSKLLKQTDWGELGLHLAMEGSGNSLTELELQLDGALETFEYLGHKYHDLHFEAQLARQDLTFTAGMNQLPLAFDLRAEARLDSAAPRAQLDMQLHRASFKTLGLREEELLARARFQAEFEQYGSQQSAQVFLRDALFQTERARYPLDSFYLVARSDSSTFEAMVAGELATGQFRGNAALPVLLEGMRAELRRHLPISGSDSALPSELALQGQLALHENALLTDLILPGLTRLDSTQLLLDYQRNAARLDVQLQAPAIDYNDLELRRLQVSLASRSDSLFLRAGFDRLVQAPYLDIYPTRLQAELDNDTVQLQFSMEGANREPLYLINSRIHQRADTTHLHLMPLNLRLQGMNWEVPADNFLVTAPAYLYTRGLELRHEGELLALQQEAADAINVVFDGFRLSNLTAMLNADSVPLRGRVEGELQFERIFTQPALLARLAVTRLRMGDAVFGNIRLLASREKANDYNFSLGMHGGDLSMRLGGKYESREGSPALALLLEVDSLQMRLLTAFGSQHIRAPEGYLSAQLNIGGSLANPQYQGNMRFREAALTINQLNNRFRLPDESIRVDENGIYIERLQLRDPNDHILSLSGQINTRSGLLNPDLQLQLEAANFQLMNSTATDNPMFYGQASINTRARLTGNFSRPVINMDARLNRGSKIVFVVPASQAELVEREGVVLFVDMRNQGFDSLFTDSTRQQEITGITLTALFQVDPETELTVVVDERSGDKLVLAGKADLRYELFPNGRMTLTGLYEVNRGSYDLSLYQVVQRKFELTKGSTIRWRGDPLDAALDLKALYRVRTNAVDLMSEQLAGADQSTRNRYRQELPFEVYTQIKGELLRPQISFSLDMPENARGALEGNVYARVQQLNSQENELNKQVFSLLVLNGFLPSGVSSTAPSASNLARGSASQLLSNQLNSLSARYIKGVDLDVNVNSFTDYESGQAQGRNVANVQVRKNLFSDRLIVEVGSQVDLDGNQSTGDLLGNVNLEYLLTENGMYRVRAFRRNQFEGIIEGQLIITGASLLYNREFNRFSEAFGSRPPRKRSDLQNKEVQP